MKYLGLKKKIKVKVELEQNIQFKLNFKQESADDHKFVQNENGLHPYISGILWPVCWKLLTVMATRPMALGC